MAETIKTILEADASGYVRQFERASKASSNLQKDAGSSFKGIAAAAGGLIGAGVVVNALVGQFNSLREEFDRIGKLSTRLDLPVEDVQVLSQVAIDAGTDMEKLANGLQKAQIAALEARDGAGSAGTAFQTLGIDAGQFAQANAVDRMKALASGFKAVGNEAEATRAIVKIMGARVALEMIPALKGGADSVDKMRASLRVLSEQDVRSIEKMNDDIDLLTKNLQVDMASAIAAITPEISAMVKVLGDALRGFAMLRDGVARGVGVGANSEMDGAVILAKMAELETERAKLQGRLLAMSSIPFLQFSTPAMAASLGIQQATDALAKLQTRMQALSGEDQAFAVFIHGVGELGKLNLPADEFSRRVAGLEAQRDASLAAAKAERDRLQAENDAAAAAVQNATLEEAAIASLAEIREKAQETFRKGELAGLDEETALHHRRQQLQEQAGTPTVSSGSMREAFDSATTPAQAEKTLALYQQILDLEQEEARYLVEKAKTCDEINKKLAKEAEEEAKKNALQTAARAAMAGDLAALQIEAAGNKEKADALRDEMQIRAQALDLAKQTGMSEQDTLKILHEKQGLQKAIAEAKLAEAGVKFAGEIDTEVRALKMELSGRKDLATALRAEVELRSKAKEVAAQTNVSEEEALKMLKEKATLQKQVDEMVDGRSPRRRGLLNKADSDAARLARRSEADRKRDPEKTPEGLRAAEERRRAAQREVEKKAKEAADPAKFWDKSLNLQEEMLKVFKGLGIV